MSFGAIVLAAVPESGLQATGLLDLPGPEFLRVYFILMIGGLAAALLIRAALRGPGGDAPGRALGRLAYCHIAGGAERDGVYHDSHAHATPPAVLDLLSELWARADPPGVMLERDESFPPEAELHRELDAIAAAVACGRGRQKAARHAG